MSLQSFEHACLVGYIEVLLKRRGGSNTPAL